MRSLNLFFLPNLWTSMLPSHRPDNTGVEKGGADSSQGFFEVLE